MYIASNFVILKTVHQCDFVCSSTLCVLVIGVVVRYGSIIPLLKITVTYVCCCYVCSSFLSCSEYPALFQMISAISIAH